MATLRKYDEIKRIDAYNDTLGDHMEIEGRRGREGWGGGERKREREREREKEERERERKKEMLREKEEELERGIKRKE